MQRPLIYFSRHGLTDWNITKRIQGQAERDITDIGRAQATANGEKLKKLLGKAEEFDFVASPLRRTRETMERIRLAMGLDPKAYEVNPALMEMNFGDWQGHMEEEIAAVHPEQVKARHKDKWNFVPPGEKAESYAMLTERFNGWLKGVTQQTMCVTHGGCLRALFYLHGGVSEVDAANMDIFQDKILRFSDAGLEWI